MGLKKTDLKMEKSRLAQDLAMYYEAWRHYFTKFPCTLQWRHDERDGISNQQPHDCLLNRDGNSPMTGEFSGAKGQ